MASASLQGSNSRLASLQKLRDAIELCGSLSACLSRNPLRPASQSSAGNAGNFKAKSTIGLMLKGTKIDSLVVGGPAYGCGMLERGDEVVVVGNTKVVVIPA